MKKILIAIFSTAFLLTAVPAYAQSPAPSTCDSSSGTFSVTDLFKTDGFLPPFMRSADQAQKADFSCVGAFISYYTQLLLFVISLAAFGYMLYGGYLYMTAFGEQAKAEQAKKTITTAIVGLIIAVLAFSVVSVLRGILGVPASPR